MSRVLLTALAVALIAGGLAAARLWQGGAPEAEHQGWVTADMVFVGADEAGRVVSLSVAEGERVKAGAPLFQLQDDLQAAELAQAEGQLSEARARLAKAEAQQQRPEEVAVLEASRARLLAALEQSRPEMDRARRLVEKGVAPDQRLEQARAAFDRDQAQIKEIEQQIRVGRLRARGEDIAAAAEVVAQALARVAQARTRLSQRHVASPAEGLVQEIYYRPGEVVAAGRPVLALMPPGNVKVRFFVPERELPQIEPGVEISVTCDGCSAPVKARVVFVSQTAEYSPPVIYSREERAKLVFRIEARPQAPEGLRVGQPVSIRIGRAKADVASRHD